MAAETRKPAETTPKPTRRRWPLYVAAAAGVAYLNSPASGFIVESIFSYELFQSIFGASLSEQLAKLIVWLKEWWQSMATAAEEKMGLRWADYNPATKLAFVGEHSWLQRADEWLPGFQESLAIWLAAVLAVIAIWTIRWLLSFIPTSNQ